MAVPKHITVKTMRGSFFQNKELSDSQDEVLTAQGVPYSIRQIAKFAKVRLDVHVEPVSPVSEEEKNSSDPNFKITMTSILSGLGFIGAAPLRAVGLPTTKTDVRLLDGSEFEQEEPVVGKFVGRMWLSTIAELESEKLGDFLLVDWDRENPEEHVIRLSVKSIKAGDPSPWAGEQVWGIQNGRYTGRVSMSKGVGDKRETFYAKLVYDYQS